VVTEERFRPTSNRPAGDPALKAPDGADHHDNGGGAGPAQGLSGGVAVWPHEVSFRVRDGVMALGGRVAVNVTPHSYPCARARDGRHRHPLARTTTCFDSIPGPCSTSRRCQQDVRESGSASRCRRHRGAQRADHGAVYFCSADPAPRAR
jgi:hypothetical protein